MDQAIVKNEIRRTVSRNAEPDRKIPGRNVHAQPDAQDRRRGEDHGEQVVQFKQIVVLYVMASMPAP